MLNTILHNFKNAVTEAVIHSGTGYSDASIVHFVDPSSDGEALHPEAINIALFGSTAQKDLLGESSFGIPNDGNTGIQQKPDLKVSLDVVLIFNFRKYPMSLDCYGQVLGYFYNNEIMKTLFNGKEQKVEVLLSAFNDRNEIEIWNSFNSPGIPLLRYDLRYAMVSGSMEELPVIKKVATESSVPKTSSLDNLTSSLIYVPVEKYISTVTKFTNSFCSIAVEADDADALIADRYSELLNSYDVATNEVTALKLNYVDTLPQYIPAIEGLIRLIGTNKEELTSNTPSKSNFAEISDLIKSKVIGIDSMNSSYLSHLDASAQTIKIVTRISDRIEAFNHLGESTFKTVDDKVLEREELSTLQLRKKWWDLESEMNKLKSTYDKEQVNDILAFDQAPFVDFKNVMETSVTSLSQAMEVFALLNVKYNSGELKEISQEIKNEYLNAYTNCYAAINYINEKPILDALNEGLQSVLIQQNK